ncbi:DUF4099 domain-containing protein [Mucilaginibacter corticis]|uniref:DUF4099 domain-containing protein n=1 Tax=Mucilaginibacter corticis TaxID=2597670 RepID=A0A556MM53_9SPHI|nr:DUF4099 domain-containing protein [Mucilaginibacter corticis]TSJ40928.1 DUF4099 domain-containing protein [Mucilaginibacter corticis]
MTQTAFEEQEIPIAEFQNLGLSKDGRLHLGEDDLKALLAGHRTEMIRLHNLTDGEIKIMHLDAKISLRRNEQGNLDLLIHPVYREPQGPAYLTDGETEKFANGELVNLDKVVEIGGVKKEVLIEFDKDTNEFIITDTAQILAPDYVNNQELTPDQKLLFRKGKEVEIRDGTKFRYTATDPNGIRSNKLHLIASLLIDGGLSYLLYRGLKALSKDEKVSEDYSRGYYDALEDMQVRKVNDRVKGKNVHHR